MSRTKIEVVDDGSEDGTSEEKSADRIVEYAAYSTQNLIVMLCMMSCMIYSVSP